MLGKSFGEETSSLGSLQLNFKKPVMMAPGKGRLLGAFSFV